jgi:hypothetical protein
MSETRRFHIGPRVGVRLGYDDLTPGPFSRVKLNGVSGGDGRGGMMIWLEMYWFCSAFLGILLFPFDLKSIFKYSILK